MSTTGPLQPPPDGSAEAVQSQDAQRPPDSLKTAALQTAILNSANLSSIAIDANGTDNSANIQASQYARSLLEASLDPLVTISPEGKITDVNEGSVKVTGVAREKLIGTDFSNYFTEPEKARQGYQQVFAKGFVTDYPLTILHQDGRLTDVLYNASVYKDVSGKVLGVFAAARDITALKQASQYARSLLEASLDPLVTISPEGKITDVNEGSVKVTGVAREKLIGTDFSNYFTEPEKARQGYQQVFAKGFVTDYALTILHREGGLTDVLYNASTYKDVSGNVLGVFAAARDITARKQVEAERQRLDRVLRETNLELQGAKFEAERANRAKSDFLSNMSHELRSPLNAILGFAQLIDTGSPPPTEEQKDSTEQILQAGWYLLELINEILDLAQIESGKLSLSTESISLDEVLRDCQAMIEPEARKSGIRVGFPEREHRLFVSADRTRVKQVFVNLLSNAIKYNRVGGSVEVTCIACPGERVRVSFEDSGEGLAPDKLAQLFQPFNRLGQQDGLKEGTGIGLVVSKQLVELMGGSIGVESTVGVGSVFWVEFNAADAVEAQGLANAPASEEPSDAAGTAPQRTVLCVEDNPANLMLITRILTRRPDIRLLSAKDGRQGIEMAFAAMPEVILMDINLPGINGVAALKILAADAATARIPVIAISANAMPSDIKRGLEAGFFSYLTKPIKVNGFMETLDLALDCARSRSEIASGEQAT